MERSFPKFFSSLTKCDTIFSAFDELQFTVPCASPQMQHFWCKNCNISVSKWNEIANFLNTIEELAHWTWDVREWTKRNSMEKTHVHIDLDVPNCNCHYQFVCNWNGKNWHCSHRFVEAKINCVQKLLVAMSIT